MHSGGQEFDPPRLHQDFVHAVNKSSGRVICTANDPERTCSGIKLAPIIKYQPDLQEHLSVFERLADHTPRVIDFEACASSKTEFTSYRE